MKDMNPVIDTNLTSSTILEKIKAKVKSLDPLAEVMLFGSRARGDARTDSDWDILILTEQVATLQIEQDFRHELFELELDLGLSLSVFVYSKGDWHLNHRFTPLYHNIKAEGILL
jgi:predicted nucleotidyltransferase